mgnify:CR=1 FL=1
MRILTVEDDELLAQTVANVLSQHHYAVDIASDGEMGWQFATTTAYDLILLDVMLPKLNGVSLCRQFRQAGYQTPILLLTAKDSGSDKVMGLDAGADDYIVKPVDFDELTARIRAILRRGHPDPSPLLKWAALTLDPGSLEVTYEGQPLYLTSTEYRLLELFLRNPQRVFSRSAIVEHLWTFDEQPEAATVKTYIKNLRQKLKIVNASADLIETVYGLGYRLKSQPQSPNTIAPVSEPDQNSKEQQVFLAVARAKDSFKAQIRDRLTVLQQWIETINAGILNVELHQQAINEAHRFAGTLGTFGFETASQLAAAIEDLLQIQPLNPHQLQQMQQLMTQLAHELENFLNQGAIATTEPSLPQLLVISNDQQWVQSLMQTASSQSVLVKQISFLTENQELKQTQSEIQNSRPDVVLLDLDMTSTSQAMVWLTELTKQLTAPVLVITRSDNFENRIEMVRRGGGKFLLKSMPIHQVIEQVIQSSQNVQTREARILVVDDDCLTLEQIQNILQPWGLQLKLLSDPYQFWQVLVSFAPDLLILDVEMPLLSGIELCRVVRTDPVWHRLPTLLLTSRSDADTIHQLFATGADDCIVKPISEAKLLTRILHRLARG